MTDSLSFAQLQELQALSAEQRYEYLLQQVVDSQQLWILVGDGGSVLLNSDGRDCVPVWPHQELADLHIEGDWADCQCQAIDLGTWQERWTKGLGADKLAVVGFVNEAEEGVIVSATEFDDDLLEAMQAED